MFDIILEENRMLLNFKLRFFDNKFKERWDKSLIVNKAYRMYGKFNSGKKFLGFSDCLKLVSESIDKIVYEWPLPKHNGNDVDVAVLEKFLATILILFIYEIEAKFSEPKDNPEQSFSLRLVLSEPSNKRTFTHGWLYPPLVTFLKEANDTILTEALAYTKIEMKRLYYYVIGTKTNFIRADCYNNELVLEVPSFMGATNIKCIFSKAHDNGKVPIEDHNVYGTPNQFLLVCGLIALNTFFRKQVQND